MAKSCTRDAPRRQELIEAATDLFHEKGYSATSVQDVADRVGILKGSVYHYIRTKEDLLFAVVEQAHTDSMAIIDDLSRQELEPSAELAAFVRAHLNLLFDENKKLSVYLHDFRSLTEKHQEYVVSKRRDYSGYLTKLIGRGQCAGVFAIGVRPEMATLAILGMLNWTHEWYRADRRSRGVIVDEFANSALRLVGTDLALHNRGCAADPRRPLLG